MPSGHDPMGGHRFSLATNAERVCAEIVLKQRDENPIHSDRIMIRESADNFGTNARQLIAIALQGIVEHDLQANVVV